MLCSRSAAIWLKERRARGAPPAPPRERGRRVPPGPAGWTLRPAGESGDRAAARGARRRPLRPRSRLRRAPRAESSSREPRSRRPLVPAERRTAPTTRPRSTTGTVTSRRSSPSVSLNLVRVSIRPWKRAARNSGRPLVAKSSPDAPCSRCPRPPSRTHPSRRRAGRARGRSPRRAARAAVRPAPPPQRRGRRPARRESPHPRGPRPRSPSRRALDGQRERNREREHGRRREVEGGEEEPAIGSSRVGVQLFRGCEPEADATHRVDEARRGRDRRRASCGVRSRARRVSSSSRTSSCPRPHG